MIELAKLLEDVSPDASCGPNLEYDSAFTELERSLQGKPEQVMGDTVIPAVPPKWDEVQKKALALFPRTKDLRVATYLIRALVQTKGLVGLSEGLAVLLGLVKSHWDLLYPQLDVGDNNDPTERINILLSLCDPEAILRNVREAPLVQSKVFGKFSLRDIAIASGVEAFVNDSSGSRPEMSSIEAAFTDSSVESVQANAAVVHKGIEQIAELESLVSEKVGVTNAPNFSRLSDVLKEIEKVFTEQLEKHGGAALATEERDKTNNVNASSSLSSGVSSAGHIGSREDVYRMLDKIIDFYKQNEPSSPIPLLLNRAKQLISKDFMEIVNDLVPAGAQQAKTLCGLDNKK